MTATVTSIIPTQQSERNERVNLSLPLPAPLYEKIKLDTILSNKTIGEMVEDWIEQDIDPDDKTLDLKTLMSSPPVREKVDPGVIMKSLTVRLSRHHAALLRLEAIRANTTVRALLRRMIRENARAWFVEPIDLAI